MAICNMGILALLALHGAALVARPIVTDECPATLPNGEYVDGGSFSNCVLDKKDTTYGIFWLKSNLELTDSTVKSAGGTYAGAIDVREDYLSIVLTRTTFTDCTTSWIGGSCLSVTRVTVEADACTFQKCSAERGGAIYCSDTYIYPYGEAISTFTFNNCKFTQCKATDGDGGALYLTVKENAATTYRFIVVQMTGCDVTDCTGEQGGAMYLNYVKFEATSSTFKNCVASNNGGALATTVTKLTVSSCTFDGCSSAKNGGAICHQSATGSVKGKEFTSTTFTGCYASVSGGAAYFSQTEEVVFKENCKFDGCYAVSGNGGAICGYIYPTLVLTNIEAVGCYTKTGNGGAIDCKKLKLSYGKFTGCSAKGYGGAIYIYADVDISISDTEAKECTASASGGFVYCSGGRKLTLTQLKCTDCSAKKSDGQAVHITTNNLEYDGLCVVGCTTPQIYIESTKTEVPENALMSVCPEDFVPPKCPTPNPEGGGSSDDNNGSGSSDDNNGSGSDDDEDDGGGSNGGAVAGIIIGVIALLIAGYFVGKWVWGKCEPANLAGLVESESRSIHDLLEAYAQDKFSEDSLGFATLATLTRVFWTFSEFNTTLIDIIGMRKYLILVKNLGPLEYDKAMLAIATAVASCKTTKEFDERCELVLLLIALGSDKLSECLSVFKDSYRTKIDGKEETRDISEAFITKIETQLKNGSEKVDMLKALPMSPFTIHNSHNSTLALMHNIHLLLLNERRWKDTRKDGTSMMTLSINDIGEATFKEPPKKPLFWMRNIPSCMDQDKLDSFLYNLSQVPFLLNACIADVGTLMHQAASKSQIPYVRELHRLGGKCDMENPGGELPLHLIKNPEVTAEFISMGVDINTRDREGFTLIEKSTTTKNWDMVKQLVEFGADITSPSPEGRYWLSWARRNNYMPDEVFTNVMSYIGSVPKAKYHADEEFAAVFKLNVRTLDFYRAVMDQNVNRIRAHLALGTNMNIFTTIDDVPTPLLIYCAKNNLIDITKMLAPNGLAMDPVNNNGENAFRVSAEMKHWDFARLMSSMGVSIDALANDGNTVLHKAYFEENKEVIDFCLESGCCTNTTNSEGLSVCFLAFRDRRDELAEVIQEKYKGNINSKNAAGASLLHLAVDDNDSDRIEYLVSRDIDIDIMNKNRMTAMTYAVAVKDKLELADLLISSGADVNARTKTGHSQLMVLASSKYFCMERFQWFMDNGADPNIRSNSGEYILSMLLLAKCFEEAEIIMDYPDLEVSDPTASLEPIVAALKIGHQEWFERLVECGATAANQHVGIIAQYLATDFFDINVLKKMTKYNFVLGGPLPLALSMDRRDVVNFLWEEAPQSERPSIANSKGPKGRTLLMFAILKKWESFIDVLMNDSYELNVRDDDGMTAAMYLANSGDKERTKKMYKMIGVKAAGTKNKANESLLTLVGNHLWRDLADEMFVDGIALDCKDDNHNLVSDYQGIVRQIEHIKKETRKNADKAKSYMSKWTSEISKAEEKLRDARRNIDIFSNNIARARANNQPTSGAESKVKYYSERAESISKAITKFRGYFNEASQVHSKYNQRAMEAASMTREDGLRRMHQFVALLRVTSDFSMLCTRSVCAY